MPGIELRFVGYRTLSPVSVPTIVFQHG